MADVLCVYRQVKILKKAAAAPNKKPAKAVAMSAVAGRHTLDPPLVAEPHHHLGHLGVGRIDQVEAAKH